MSQEPPEQLPGTRGASETQGAPENREESPPAPPEELKPWYYQYWFLYPTIIFWPLWPVLIIRSPWHNGLVSGAIAWAMLFVGSYLVYQGSGGTEVISKLQAGGAATRITLQLILPGLILTVVTQVHWLRNRRRILDAAKPAGSTTGSPGAGTAPDKPARSRSRPRRRGNRRRASRR